MNLELLRTFVDAARSPTLGAAAARRHVTKSAVSQQLKALEAQLGIALFERAGRNVRPTEAARALAESLATAFALVDDAIDGARSSENAVRGEVKIAAPRPFTRFWLRPRLAKLLVEHPELLLEVSFGVASELERAVVSGDLDLAILGRATDMPSLESAPLYVESFEAVASPAYLRKHGVPRQAEDFSGHRLIVFDHDLAMHAPWWRATFGARAPLRGAIACRVASLDEMLALAIAGVGITVLPTWFVAEALTAKELSAVRPSMGSKGSKGSVRAAARNTLFLAWRRGAQSARVRTVREALEGSPSS